MNHRISQDPARTRGAITSAARFTRRAAAASAAVACAALVVGISTPAEASTGGAADPDVHTLVVGGDVIRHDSIQNLVIAKDIQFTNGSKGSNCDIWNRNGGNTWDYVQAVRNCTTASMNGQTYSWTVWNDTDAFTMQYEGYWVSMHGSWRWIGANVYTRIHDDENAHCYRESDGVNCYVSYG
ncbi:MAG TPA: hypothetical protein VGP70_18045 [Actinomadura sp.]|nr:hypothetical protein [Actinomadura sp.]